MKDKKLYAFIIILYVVSIPLSAGAALKILEGEHTVIYDIVNPRGVAFIPDYSNESFEQKVISQDEFSKRVRVTSRMHPMKTRVPFPIQPGAIPPSISKYLAPERERQSGDPTIVRVAREVTRESRYAHEAANAILSWVADNLTFDTSISVPSDAVSAMRYGRAYCVGYSNLAVALLRAAGIPARVAHGYLPPGYEWGFSKEYWGVKVNDGGFHAYIEIYYPDAGWVFSDAEHSHNFVDPFHIILRLDGMNMPGEYSGGFLDVDNATFYTIYQEEDRTVMVDEMPLPKQKRLGRRLDGRQHSALISGRVLSLSGSPVSKGTAVAWRDGRGVPYPFTDGRFAIPLHEPGKYRIELKGPGYAKSSRDVVVEKGKVYHLDYNLKPGGVVKGRVLSAAGAPVTEGDVFYRDGNAGYGVPIDDKDGTYRIEGLAAGEYKVTVTTSDKSVSKIVRVEEGSETAADFVIK